ncbi:CGNR zinc finger domain-containing protein [Streptomyces sp. Je 1-369]|uniref:CGNR zinc finger domain-containing protein n=1 Tax=Streptomyces sp. Je 1-369 TaxID=2966192 RepID=UPI0022869FB4|nr:CGNR zinc finger domain-containing protein [Streptomyces sp. Je 1-369]WAL93153.1 CGNR zinc finger domain-containing protein [Streptomyces sp. Je 1-369]
MRSVEEFVTEEAATSSAPGEDEHPALALANSALVLPGGRTVDLLGTPAQAEQWLARRDLAPADAGLAEVCAARLRVLREQVRSLLASRVAGQPAPPAAVTAVNDAMTRVPTASLLMWDAETGPYRATPHPTTAIVEHALAVIASDAADLLTASDAARLTACASPPCNRFLLKHGRRQWCSTRCGDRARAARAYARRTTMD